MNSKEAPGHEQSESAYKNSRSDLQDILDAVPDMIAQFDRNLRYTFTNNAFSAISKRPREYYLGRKNSELEIQKDFYPLWDKKLQEVFETGVSNLLEYEDNSSGETRYYQAKFTPEFDNNKNIKAVLTVTRDITDQAFNCKETAEALTNAKRMFDGGPVVVFQRRGGMEDPLVYVSNNTFEQFGYAPQELLSGKVQYYDLIHPEDKDYWLSVRKKAQAGAPFGESEHRARRADGEYRWIYEKFHAEKDETGAIVGYRGYLFDITERKNSEKLIEASEKKYRELVEAANVIILHLDEKGTVLFINRFGLEFFGYNQTEIVNRTIKETILPQIESTGRELWNRLDAFFENPAQFDRSVVENVLKDGRRVWIEWTNRFHINPITKKVNLVTVGVDLTARRQAEKRLKLGFLRERRNKLFRDILEGRIPQDEFIRSAKTEGIVLTAPFVCYVININRVDHEANLIEAYQEWETRLECTLDLINVQIDGYAWLLEDRIVILNSVLEYSPNRQQGMIDKLTNKLKGVVEDSFRSMNYVIGVSKVQANLLEAYRQASHAVDAGPVFKTGERIFHWRDLGISQLLFEQANSDGSNEFINEWIGPLLNSPANKKAEVLNTLDALLAGGSVNEIADRLHIHPKTLAFRRGKIEKLLQRKLDDPETFLNIATAYKLVKLQDKMK